MNILVTGAAGYLGSYLVPKLLALGHRVYSISRRKEIIIVPGLIEIQGDLNDKELYKNLPDSIDIIYHLAQSNEYRNFPGGALDMLNVNVNATILLADFAYKIGVKKFIFTSTGSIYKPAKNQLSETAERCEDNFYSSTKIAAENLLIPYSTYFQLFIPRIFGLFGPLQKDKLIPNLLKSIQNDIPITLINGTGHGMNYIYIEDCCNILTTLIDLTILEKYYIFNVSGDIFLSLKEIVNLLELELNHKAILQTKEGEQKEYKADLTKLFKIIPNLNFIDLPNAIQMTVRAKHHNHKI